ncbi:MAG: twin-arginine translocation signal domain-containing protein [Bacteroidales bacterium]|nr:twin-arginine translocation signal domain-containing protein [Bacteroidales bacterium]MBP3344134.1 twin-arginine translocation signal domain-containing protein [Bacteroidales bacterium]MBQ3521276.1 twin-arginine translocation signal domain-containing protein [Bacteroidales bacterium]MBQ5803089.1 twin-arginine translocation signal domain-containing protein [Bacteroidales bacterium]MBQ6870734.1 twin-arginine translocation signal domain-containing protein [Bacteroidales bacterium]
MITNRRNFLKSAGMLTAAAALFNPATIFAQKGVKKSGGSKKLELSFVPYNAQMKHAFAIATSVRTTTPIVLTQITYDGVTGYGEAAMPPYLGETQASVIEFLKKVDLSKFSSPFLIDDIMKYVDSIAINNTAAKAAVDIALHDLVGKLIGQPWWKIWGFDPTVCPNTSFTVGLDTEEVVKEKTREASPYKVIKVKLGRDEATDKMMINTIRSVTDTMICVDANQGWKDKHYALDMIHWLNERNVKMIEQPMSKYLLDETAWLTENSPLPIYADEACQRLTDIQKLKGAYTGINIKLMKCTGMREAREMVSLAEALNMKLMIGCMTETSCAISAAAQLAPKMEWADLDGNLLITNDCYSGMKIVDGKITLNDKPGIGIEKI